MNTGLIFFISLSAAIVILVLGFQLKKPVCPNCKSSNIVKTGNKKYKEDPVSLLGSPDSYHQIEYKCLNCGKIFWNKWKAFIFN